MFLSDLVSLVSTLILVFPSILSLLTFLSFTVIPGILVLTLVSVIPCVLVIPGNFSMTGIPETLVIPGIPVFLPVLVLLGNSQDSGHRQRRKRRYGKEPKDKSHRRNKQT